MTTDLPGIAKKIDGLADCLSGETHKRSLRKAGMAGKKAALAVAEEVAGGDRAITMGRGRRVFLGAGYDLEGDNAVKVVLRPPGPWVLFEKGAKAHRIPKRRSDGFMAIQDFGHSDEGAASVDHPGRSGRRAVSRAFKRVEETVPQAYSDALFAEMARSWR